MLNLERRHVYDNTKDFESKSLRLKYKLNTACSAVDEEHEHSKK